MLISPGKNVDLTIEIPMNNEDPMDFTGIDGDFTRKHWYLSPNFHPWMVVFFFSFYHHKQINGKKMSCFFFGVDYRTD